MTFECKGLDAACLQIRGATSGHRRANQLVRNEASDIPAAVEHAATDRHAAKHATRVVT